MIEKYKSAFNVGIISGLILFASFMAILFLGYNPVGQASAMYYWVPIPILIRHLRLQRVDVYPQGMPYLEGLKNGTIITFVYSALYALLVFVLCIGWEPHFIQFWLDQKIEALHLVATDGTFMSIPVEEVIAEWERNKFFSIAFDEFLYKFIFGVLVTLIASFVFRKPKRNIPIEQ